MAKSRNERRKAAQARLSAKTERIAKASLMWERDQRDRKVFDNLNSMSPKTVAEAKAMRVAVKADRALASNMGGFAGQAHRGYVSAASGTMSKRSTQAVMMKVANRHKDYDTYARPVERDDPRLFPIVDKAPKAK